MSEYKPLNALCNALVGIFVKNIMIYCNFIIFEFYDFMYFIAVIYFFAFSRCSRCRTRMSSSHVMGGLPRLNCTSLAFRVFSSMSPK